MNTLKRRSLRPSLLLLAAAGASLLVPRGAHAGMPQPSAIYYGQARDEYGWPYREGAVVILRAGTNEIVRHAISGSLAPGINFMLPAPIDDGRDAAPYVRQAASTGAAVSIVVVDERGERTIMEKDAVPPVERPGAVVRINVTAALDADGDGLPDEWEWELIRWATDPACNSLADIRPQDDFDGDGQSNLEELRAGTFAFLADDRFCAETFRKAASGRLHIQCFGVPGKVYRVESAPVDRISGGYAWAACDYSPTESGAWRQGPIEGEGGWLSFYLPPPGSNLVWRLKVE